MCLVGRAGERARGLGSDEGADETGSLLDAFGLPLQLQDDNLPEIAPASQPDRPGIVCYHILSSCECF